MQRLIKKTMTKALFFPTQGILRHTSCKHRQENNDTNFFLSNTGIPSHKRSCMHRPIEKTMIQPFFFPAQGIPSHKRSCLQRPIKKILIQPFFSSTGHTQTQKVLHVQTDQKTMIEPLLFLRQKYPGIKCPACTD